MGTLPTQLDPRTLALMMSVSPGAAPRDVTTANMAALPTQPPPGTDPMTTAALQQMKWGATEAPEQLARARAASSALGETLREPVP